MGEKISTAVAVLEGDNETLRQEVYTLRMQLREANRPAEQVVLRTSCGAERRVMVKSGARYVEMPLHNPQYSMIGGAMTMMGCETRTRVFEAFGRKNEDGQRVFDERR